MTTTSFEVMEKYILIGEIANKLSGNQETEGVIYEIASIFFRKTMGSKFCSQKEGNHELCRSVIKRK